MVYNILFWSARTKKSSFGAGGAKNEVGKEDHAMIVPHGLRVNADRANENDIHRHEKLRWRMLRSVSLHTNREYMPIWQALIFLPAAALLAAASIALLMNWRSIF